MRLRLAFEESLKAEESQVEFEIEALDDAFEQFENLCDVKDENLSIEIVEIEMPKACENDNVPMNDAKHSYSCNVCSKSYLHLNSLSRHIQTTHELKRYSCPVCQSEFTQRSSLAEHISNLHKTTITKNIHRCSSCRRTFNTSKMLLQHLRHHDRANDIREIRSEKSSNKKYRKQCQICGLFFKHIDEHKLSHQGEIFIFDY